MERINVYYMTIMLKFCDYAIQYVIFLYVYYKKYIPLHRFDNIHIAKTKDNRFVYK